MIDLSPCPASLRPL